MYLAKAGLDALHPPLRLDTGFDGENAQTDAGRLCQHDFRACFPAFRFDQNAQHLRRAVFLHIDRGCPDIQRTCPQKSVI